MFIQKAFEIFSFRDILLFNMYNYFDKRRWILQKVLKWNEEHYKFEKTKDMHTKI